jgi:transposase
MVRIGEDRSERLDIIPAQFRVIVTIRPRYACPKGRAGVVQEKAPPALIEGGLPTEATIAHVLVSKYSEHLPLYRQAQVMARHGLSIDRSTLADWVGRAAFHLASVVERMATLLKRSGKLFMDETTALVLDPGRGRTKTGYLWAMLRDDRPWGGDDPPGAVPMGNECWRGSRAFSRSTATAATTGWPMTGVSVARRCAWPIAGPMPVARSSRQRPRQAPPSRRKP